jgi:signal transduction histidine kinase
VIPLAPVTATADRAARPWVWLQMVIGWVPIWALFVALMVAAHGGSVVQAGLVALRAIASAAVLGLLLVRLVNRWPWPARITWAFVAVHTIAALAFAPAWVLLTSVIESLLRWQVVLVSSPIGLAPYLVFGLWLYVAVVGVLYAVRATARAGRAEAAAAETKLASLRSQLNPHFLFNALHTVVQLIPIDPKRASVAAEQLSGLLRSALEESREEISLREELMFVERYLALEHLRFGDRLLVSYDVAAAARGLVLPAFALQTLVENAVRHGAAPNVAPTSITIAARVEHATLTLVVTDTGVGVGSAPAAASGVGSSDAGGTGTGLQRLEARLHALYGARATVQTGPGAAGGFRAALTLPARESEQV